MVLLTRKDKGERFVDCFEIYAIIAMMGFYRDSYKMRFAKYSAGIDTIMSPKSLRLSNAMIFGLLILRPLWVCVAFLLLWILVWGEMARYFR